MSADSKTIRTPALRPSLPAVATGGRAAGLAASAFLGGVRAALFAVGALLLVGLVSLADVGAASRLSFALFYLIPVAACA